MQNVLRERKQDGLKKPEGLDFRQYVEMRRGLSGADGKSRSKGHPNGGSQKKGNEQSRGRSFLRPTQLTTLTKGKIAAASANKIVEAAVKPKTVSAETRQGRIANGFQAAKDHFKNVATRVKGAFGNGGEGKRANQLPQSNVAQAAKHSVKQRVADAGVTAKQQAKVQQKAPPPPVVKGKR